MDQRPPLQQRANKGPLATTFKRRNESNGKFPAARGSPRRKDIIFGRGKPSHTFPGNRRMLKIIAAHREEYKARPRALRRAYAETVLNLIVADGAKFMRRVSTKNEEEQWEEVNRSEAADKVWHALRCEKIQKEPPAPCVANVESLPPEVSERVSLCNTADSIFRVPAEEAGILSANQLVSLIRGANSVGFMQLPDTGLFRPRYNTEFCGSQIYSQALDAALLGLRSAENRRHVESYVAPRASIFQGIFLPGDLATLGRYALPSYESYESTALRLCLERNAIQALPAFSGISSPRPQTVQQRHFQQNSTHPHIGNREIYH